MATAESQYLDRLISREIEKFRKSAPMTTNKRATEVAQHGCPPLPATGHDPPPAQATDMESATRGEENKRRPAAFESKDINALVDADEAANGFRGTSVRLFHLRNTTTHERFRYLARRMRIYRLAHKIGVAPGGARWVRGGQPYMQPAVPLSVTRADGTVEYNQFMLDEDDGRVVLRMPGGWKRGLVRDRAKFLGVAVVDGFLWPLFHSLRRNIRIDWEDQGFVEFNEVRYTTPFKAREP
ncbi:hypothetical protein N8I77_000288 [Diaporthe amygdali]|uniref:Uncharacterized protein n=1 Tax=Phomopsis amygdali TaxID=1214568 RepID=A0AAD9SQK4_PHOAM|nr:hypothetical protein N8I77_000288 [Diaporthe amygdali]